MSSADDSDVAQRFADLWAAIRASEQPLDMIDRIRDALDRKADGLARQQPHFIEGSFAIDAVAYQTETTQILQVTHRDLGTRFAVKTTPEKRRDDAQLIQRLRREAEIGIALRHSCLLETSALLRLADGRPGLLQPWMPVTLASRLAMRPLTLDEISSLLRRVLQAVAAIHAEAYVHGDITPANILLPDGEIESAKLGDFGIARKIGESPSDAGIAFAGSTEFAAPEQLAGMPAHPRQDVYGLGRLAQRMLNASPDVEDDKLSMFAEVCTKDGLERPQSIEEALGVL
ncbi:protein kinase [Agrobacterium sp. BA1120]|uniref:protein kinase domain-containing protein n=1 Tax=Agrobacterium sp. BA1120 TaxID=3228927 RepID=UPI00336A7CBA